MYDLNAGNVLLCFFRIALIFCFVAVIVFTFVDVLLITDNPYNLFSLLGIFVYALIYFVTSSSPMHVSIETNVNM